MTVRQNLCPGALLGNENDPCFFFFPVKVALVAARAFRATGRKELPEPADGACPLLKRETGRCLIYTARPFGCRTHFCEAAGGPWPRPLVLDLIRRLESVDQQLGGDGPRKIEAALRSELSVQSGRVWPVAGRARLGCGKRV